MQNLNCIATLAIGVLIITPLKNPARRAGGRKPEALVSSDFWGGFERKLQKKVHNGSENSENKKKYGVAEKSVKKSPDLGPNGIGHNSG